MADKGNVHNLVDKWVKDDKMVVCFIFLIRIHAQAARSPHACLVMQPENISTQLRSELVRCGRVILTKQPATYSLTTARTPRYTP